MVRIIWKVLYNPESAPPPALAVLNETPHHPTVYRYHTSHVTKFDGATNQHEHRSSSITVLMRRLDLVTDIKMRRP